MKRIGLFGGTFDPPHYGHLLMAEQAYQALKLDEIWFIPSFQPPHKEDAKTTAKDRVAMTSAAISDHPAFYLNTIEVERKNKSYTLLTIKELKEKYTNYSFYFIIGGGMVEYLPKWHKVDTLMEMITFVGVNRTSFTLDTTYPVEEVDMPLIDISSTIIRKCVGQNKSIRYLTTPEVIQVIKEKKLYLK